MKRTQIILLAALALLGALVAYLSLSSRQPPMLPIDSEHAAFGDLSTCRDCHGPDGDFPRGRNHPVGEDCARCHGIH